MKILRILTIALVLSVSFIGKGSADNGGITGAEFFADFRLGKKFFRSGNDEIIFDITPEGVFISLAAGRGSLRRSHVASMEFNIGLGAELEDSLEIVNNDQRENDDQAGLQFLDIRSRTPSGLPQARSVTRRTSPNTRAEGRINYNFDSDRLIITGDFEFRSRTERFNARANRPTRGPFKSRVRVRKGRFCIPLFGTNGSFKLAHPINKDAKSFGELLDSIKEQE